jgi:hypothetical protein
MKGCRLADMDGAKKYWKQLCVVGQGCSIWAMSLMFSAEKMKMKQKNS